MARHLPISERDRAEASVVTARGTGHQFEIQLGHLCNNRCVFCISGQLTEMKLARSVPVARIFEALDDARARGARRLTFLGGEPTIQKGFLASLRHAVALGFEEIAIFTNGVLFPHPGFIDEVVALGRFEWRVSIQGGNEEAHVAVTGRADSFRRIVEGLEMLRARGQLVTANLCVNTRSYRSLPDYPALARTYGLRQLHVDMLRPGSVGFRTYDYLLDIMPRYALVTPHLDAMLTAFERDMPDFEVSVGNLPYCTLPQWSHRIQHGGEPTESMPCDDDGRDAPVDKYARYEAMRQHLPGCASCVMRPRCAGVFTEYLELYGPEEFRPITLAQLRAVDPAQRSFVLLVEGALSPLVDAPMVPVGWLRERVAREHVGRYVEVVFLSATGGRVTLRFEPRDGRGEADGITDVYRVAVRVDPEVDEGALSPLLRWVGGRLGAAEDVAVTRALDAEAVVLRTRALRRGRARIEAMLARAEGLARVGAWRCEVVRADAVSESAIVMVGVEGARVEVGFALGAREGRSQVSLDVRRVEVASPEGVRAAVEALARALEPRPQRGWSSSVP